MAQCVRPTGTPNGTPSKYQATVRLSLGSTRPRSPASRSDRLSPLNATWDQEGGIAVVRLVTFGRRSAGIVAFLGLTITVATRRGAHNNHMREGSTHRAPDTRMAVITPPVANVLNRAYLNVRIVYY